MGVEVSAWAVFQCQAEVFSCLKGLVDFDQKGMMEVDKSLSLLNQSLFLILSDGMVLLDHFQHTECLGLKLFCQDHLG